MAVVERGHQRTGAAAKRPDLQGMRAVAVLAVFADHLFGWPSGGFVGVDIFFVLSGFFITGLLIRERTTTGELSFQNFYTRRVKRILPSALLVLAVTVIGGYILFTSARAKETLVDALYAAVFGANFRFQAVGADYFQATRPPSPIQHYWSLSIEEQFYFVWPLLLVVLFAITRRHRRRGQGWVRQWGLFGAMGLVVAASFGWAMWQSGADPNAAYFSTFTRVWELGVGALLAIAGPWMARIPGQYRPVIAYLGLAGVVASLFVISSASRWPAPWAALPVLSTALVVAAFHEAPLRGMQLLDNPVMRWFGDTSYTLYLWHWPVIVLLLAVFPKGALFYSLAAGIALALTAITYHFYEDPIRKSRWLLIDSEGNGRSGAQLWAVAGAVAALLAVVSILWIRQADLAIAAQRGYHSPGAGGTPAPALVAPDMKNDPCFGAAAMVTPGCKLWNPDEPIVPEIDELTADSQAFDCFREEGEPLKSCTYGYKGPDPAARIALVGDSHAAAMLPGIWPILDENRWQLTTFVGESCRFDIPGGECRNVLDEVQAKLLADRYDVLILTGSRKFGGNFGVMWGAIHQVVGNGTHVAFITDTPLISEDSMQCLTRATGSLGDCGTPRAEALAKPDVAIEATNRIKGSTLIDLTRFYCDDTRCPMIIGNAVVYFDAAAHLTETYAETLAPAIRDGLRAAVPVKAPAAPR